MVKVIKDTQVFINGVSQVILAGKEYPDDHAIVGKLRKGTFMKIEAPKANKTAKEVPEVANEELLIEEPVQDLEVTETKEESKTPVRHRRKKS